jgi:hypothetical protein
MEAPVVETSAGASVATETQVPETQAALTSIDIPKGQLTKLYLKLLVAGLSAALALVVLASLIWLFDFVATRP